MTEEIKTGDKVTHWSHSDEIGEVVRTEQVRTGGRVLHVVWPSNPAFAIPYNGMVSLKKYEAPR